ncbi:MAG: GNAT family N-acetyltransferase [Clostridia bacterium]|nr:GNAT family N-acetyltransferase [Clostridia bacterium]
MSSVSLDGEDGGIIYYRLSEDGGRRVCRIPSFGYYASSEKALSMLFSRLSEELIRTGDTRFEVHLWAHDTTSQRLFSLMQFGCIAESGIIKKELCTQENVVPFTLRTLGKEEICERWNEIWKMTSSIIDHLKASPIFYPSEEFTEEAYRDFFLDSDTALHVAFDGDGTPVGMIETNGEPCPHIGAASANVGEAYVIPELRGTGLADALFFHALRHEKDAGAVYLWVEHGTANPQARGFWGRYFDAFEYELDRFIGKI